MDNQSIRPDLLYISQLSRKIYFEKLGNVA